MTTYNFSITYDYFSTDNITIETPMDTTRLNKELEDAFIKLKSFDSVKKCMPIRNKLREKREDILSFIENHYSGCE